MSLNTHSASNSNAYGTVKTPCERQSCDMMKGMVQYKKTITRNPKGILWLQTWAISSNIIIQQQLFYNPLPGTTRVRQYPNIHPLTPILIITILYQHPPSTTIHSILPVQFMCWQSFCTTSLKVLFGLPLGLASSTLYSIHFFTQSLLLFTTHAHTIASCFTVVPRLYHLILVSLNSLLGTVSFILMSHIHLTILIFACWSATSLSFLAGQVSLPCNILLHS